MSGIVGIVHFDGAPVDRDLLGRMTTFMAFRGPDAQQIWLDGNVGFGHTLLRTTDESEHERQPLTLDGRLWIVADARVDARSELIPLLQSKGHADLANNAPDVELILRAYQTWGEACVEHLLGDFAFAIWDAPRQRLFCARDHMGVKPFCYAHVGNTVVFSNTLDCVRLHPAVSNKLNDLAIADFLLFEGNQNSATTSFADIQRIPPAYNATWSNSGLKLCRYWTLPVDEPIFYRRAQDYVDRFKELLRRAVTERLRTRRVGIFMSGGLDSPTLAATIHDLQREHYGVVSFKAFTSVLSYGPNERYYADLVAKHLGIPIEFESPDGAPIDLNWERRRIHTPEPAENPWRFPDGMKRWCELATYSRVFFYGEGPDNALRFEWQPYFRYLLREQLYGLFLRALFNVAVRGPIPFSGRIPRKIRELTSGWKYDRNRPDYLNSSLESSLKLRARWEHYMRPLTSPHPVRPEGYASMHIPLWQGMFEGFDAGWTGAPMQLRHPYVDLRMMRFLLAVPSLPWCRSKYLLRRAMRDVLPKSLLSRSKQGVPVGPRLKHLTQLASAPMTWASDLGYYVDEARLPKTPSDNLESFGDVLRVRALNYWLQHFRGKLNIRVTEDTYCEPFPESGTNIVDKKAV